MSTQGNSRFIAWCEEYCTVHNMTLSRLALEAGLSAGTLHAYRRDSNKEPAWETVSKIAFATGTDCKYLAELAGLPDADKLAKVNPLRTQLLTVFDDLPTPAQRGLLVLAKALQQVIGTMDQKN